MAEYVNILAEIIKVSHFPHAIRNNKFNSSLSLYYYYFAFLSLAEKNLCPDIIFSLLCSPNRPYMGTFSVIEFFNDFPFRGKIVLPLNTGLQRKAYFWRNFYFKSVVVSRNYMNGLHSPFQVWVAESKMFHVWKKCLPLLISNSRVSLKREKQDLSQWRCTAIKCISVTLLR